MRSEGQFRRETTRNIPSSAMPSVNEVAVRFACGEPRFTYSHLHEPVGVVKPGEVFQVETVDCFSGLYQTPEGFSAENRKYTSENLDGVTGPIYIDGATPNHTVAITLHEIAVTSLGSVVVSRYENPLPKGWWLEEYTCDSYRIQEGELLFSDSLRIPLRPVVGCIATAPARETVLSVRQGQYGGNMDCAEIGPKATIVLPVAVEGALLYFGDCKAMMGDGEIAQPPEVGTVITASVELRPVPARMTWPRVETTDRLMTVVSGPSLEESCRLAFKELLDWIEPEYGMSRGDAALLMAMVADTGICQISNALHTAKCSIPRRWLTGKD